MKIPVAILGATFCLSLAQPAAGWQIDRCFTIPENPPENTPFILCAQGRFLTPAWTLYYDCWGGGPMPCPPAYQIQGNQISSTLYYYKRDGIWIQVITPWEQYIYVSEGLPRGIYSATVNYQLWGSPTTAAAQTRFFVGQPPAFNSQTISDTNLVLRWTGESSFLYTIQYSTQLTENIWKSVPSFSYIDGTSNTMEYQAPISNGPPRMFRIMSTVK